MTTWKKELEEAFETTEDTFDDIVSITLSEEELNREFHGGYGGSEGVPFTAWSKKWVYFPVVYDGAEWVGYVSRDPNGKATDHVGGE